jgi:hypothetical protein
MENPDEVVDQITAAVTDEERAAIEAAHLVQTDNSARDGDTPQGQP